MYFVWWLMFAIGECWRECVVAVAVAVFVMFALQGARVCYVVWWKISGLMV